MSKANLEQQVRAPLLDSKFPAPRLLHPSFSQTWVIVTATITQAIICGLVWAFVGTLMDDNIIALPDNVAHWVRNKPSETNMVITVISTVLGITTSSLLGITVQQALTFRLSRSIDLSIVTAWIQLARNSLFFQPRRHLWWTLISLLWVISIHFLTTAWSNLLTPEIVVQQFPMAGRDLDFLSPVLSNYTSTQAALSFITPTTENFTLTPKSLGFLANITGYLSQAGRSAASIFVDPEYVAFIGPFNTSTGGLSPIPPQDQLSSAPALPANYQGLSTSYSFVQQGYTANVSCRQSSSPIISLNNTASAERTFNTPFDYFNYTVETWSWSTNCSGNKEYYTGDVDILKSDGSVIGNGLFATSLCLHQDFSGPSNQSFLLLMQSPSNSGYNASYFVANPNLPIVCQFTPMVTTLQVQYNESNTATIDNILNQTIPPEYSWPLASIEGSVIWAAYLFAQGPYSNSYADDPLEAVYLLNQSLSGDIMPVLEQYLRGIFEYMGSVLRGSIESSILLEGQSLPDNMTIPISGTMDVQTMGWISHARTHGIALSVITLVTLATLASGIYALLEAQRQSTVRGPSERGGNAATFDPTNLMDILVASSTGNLANILSQPKSEGELEKLKVELTVTEGGQYVLNACADDAPEDASKAEFASEV